MAVREGVGLFDMTSFGKIRVEGRDACAFLQRLCANEMDVPGGRIVYTQMLNARGGIEADLTVTGCPRPPSSSSSPAPRCSATWPGCAAHGTTPVVITDVTAAEAVLPDGPARATCWPRQFADDARQRRLPLRHRARDRDRDGPRPRAPHHLCRRAGLGALCLRRPGRPCLRGADGGRPRPDALRPARDGQLPHRKGLPPFRPRHHRRGSRARSRARLRRQDGQGRLHRPRRGAAQTRGGAVPPHGAVPAAGPRRHGLSQRTDPARRTHRRHRHQRQLRPPPRRLGRHGLRPQPGRPSAARTRL
jgi:hypothetical protein